MNKLLSLIILVTAFLSCETKNTTSNKRNDFIADSLKQEQLRYTIINDTIQTSGITRGSKLHWKPNQKQILSVITIARETILTSESEHSYHLKADSLNSFYKQLVCYVDGKNDSLVYINGFCRVWNIPRIDSTGQVKYSRFDWHNILFRVEDGGDCYWSMLINFSKKETLEFYVNGNA